jgi:hypothetical protein
MSDVEIAKFFAMGYEREQIRLRKEAGYPKPWTSNPIFLDNRFCNVHREDDKTTRWFAENMRDHEDFCQSERAILMTTVAFRWFNKIEIGKVLMDPAIGLQNGCLDTAQAKRRILAAYPDGPFVTGAYVVKSPNGINKLDGVLWMIKELETRYDNGAIRIFPDSLESTHDSLGTSPFMGPFMAYEVVTDLYHTPLLRGALDIMTWANPGPGAARGLSRIFHGDPEVLSRGSHKDRATMLKMMRDILEFSRDVHWTRDRPWDMRTVEHGLCEYDKFERCREGGRMKQRYPGRIAA